MSTWTASAAMTAAPSDPFLPVVETFHSLQGEGMHSGRSAFFIRLAGCRVGCSWCDTKHSWPQGQHPQVPLQALVDQACQAAAAGGAFVVVTGGEPLHHNLDGLCAALTRAGLPLHLETSGVDPLSGRFSWITLSPKPHAPPLVEALARCDELKVVVNGPSDLAFAQNMADAAFANRPAGSAGPVLLLQPGWNSPEGQALALAHVQANPAWRLSLQSHKLLGVR
jgi:7-carboxy-7-deazaguanine synthase